MNEDKHGLTLEELEAESVEQLPDRELMGSLIKTGPILPGGIKIRIK